MTKQTRLAVIGLCFLSVSFCIAPPLTSYPTLLDWLGGVLMGIAIGLQLAWRAQRTGTAPHESA